MRYMKLSDFGQVIMGMSPSGETYNEKGEGLPLLNGPTEFTSTCPIPKLYTTDSKRECKVGDLFFCVRGSTTGKMNWADQVFSIGRGVCAIRGKNTIDTKYIKYCIEQNLSGLLAIAGGGTFPNLKKDDIGNFEIPIINNRQRIVEVLSAYDDLIENNLKRIKVLEETAQNIYKEWFVNFRFPNYEHTEFDGVSGLPVGWEMKKVEDCIKVMKGKKPKKEYSTIGENRILYLLVDVLERRELRFTENESVQLTSDGETLMLMDGSRSGLVFKSLEGAIGSTLAVFRIKNAVFGINYCFNYFKFREVEIISKNTGSAIPHANKSYIYGMEIPIPSDEISTEFEKITSKIYQQIEILSSQNQKLKEARDILLPRLMNRTIEV